LPPSADNDAVHVRRIAGRVSKPDAVRPRVQTNWNRGREREVRASAAQIQRNIRLIVGIDDERAGAGRHGIDFHPVHARLWDAQV
jgi:hypothetical protein